MASDFKVLKGNQRGLRDSILEQNEKNINEVEEEIGGRLEEACKKLDE